MTNEKTLKHFTELNKEKQLLCLANHRNILDKEYKESYESVKDMFIGELEAIGFFGVETSFTKLYNEDGFIVDFKGNYESKKLECCKPFTDAFKEFAKRLDCYTISAVIKHNACFEKGELEGNGESNINKYIISDNHDASNEMVIEEIFKDIAKFFWSQLKVEHKHLISDESLIEHFSSDNYYFNSDFDILICDSWGEEIL